MELNLRGKTAIVTGGSRGLGAAVCARLAREGANVLLSYVASRDKAESLAAGLSSQFGVRAEAFRADVSLESDVVALFAHAKERFGTVDLLINNAGVCPMMPIKDTSYELWIQVLAVNMGGVFLCCREMIRQAVAAGKPANIVNIASATAYLGSRNGKTHYAASKGGVISFTTSLAKEVARDHIRVNAFAPAIMYTDMTAELLDRDMAKYEQQIPIGRIATLEEAADAVLYLASDASAYMTGSVLDFSGGQLGR
ncbi:MAG TPA: SDR family NAD(P)-dependent oxidoreductase [Clostridia bacterium]|nr:SDR family NAD(P)-dependent oxidoreductase [Clostridia bacterium]